MMGKNIQVDPNTGTLFGPGISSNGLASLHFNSAARFGECFTAVAPAAAVLWKHWEMFPPRCRKSLVAIRQLLRDAIFTTLCYKL